jgi:hypothetical protein
MTNRNTINSDTRPRTFGHWRAKYQANSDRSHRGRRTPQGLPQRSFHSEEAGEGFHPSHRLSSYAAFGGPSGTLFSAFRTCRKAVCLSYNANRTQKLREAGIGMKVASVLLRHSHGCVLRSLQGTAQKHSGYVSSYFTVTHQFRSVTRTGFTCTHSQRCREFISRHDFRKASVS